MPSFPSTMLPQTNEPEQIQKAILDLLDKINRIATSALPPGTIQMYGGASAPDGFLLCDGVTYRRMDYAALFAKIGTTFGAPDAATFNVPDFRGVSPTGPGAQDINGRTKTGPALGEVREDAMQGHWHREYVSATNITAGATGFPGIENAAPHTAALADANTGIKEAIDDGTNGTPRTGAYTHGPEIGVNFIIKT